ncbi:phospholipase A [Helicobacter sp. MIT 14-3879]|uniref:phospholipase A n=1 Tax=Helicobacter sp. MIT 14-3879 TaxID=2040649 RepID=UPI000E1F0442|nr:phospholipase A [Helicobacter sp. MIT 14-3879]RDU62253.1 hypothetical protein CQA44_07090 [Helicobacter sp. MIT 14-3879]
MSYLNIIILFSLIIYGLNGSENSQSIEAINYTKKQDCSKITFRESSKNSKTKDSATQDEIKDYEFPYYHNLDTANSFIKRFSLHNENYFLPIYYQSTAPSPYKKYEIKLQFSAKANIFQNISWGLGAFFAYTQKSFFQIYSPKLSSPFRNNDYIPELIIYKTLDTPFLGGKLYNIRFGFKHISNGEENVTISRGVDLILAEIMYKIENFRLKLKAWAYIRKDPKNIDKYLGYSDLILEYDFLSRNNLKLTISNLFHNYAKYKGNVLLEYKFNLENFAIYAQYFYGYGDNIFEYNFKKNGIGIGIAIATF